MPIFPAAGVNDNVPSEATVGPEAKSPTPPSLTLTTWNDTVWLPSLAGPGLIALAHAALYAPLSGSTVTAGPGVKVGGSLIGASQMDIVAVFEVVSPSVAWYVKVSETQSPSGVLQSLSGRYATLTGSTMKAVPCGPSLTEAIASVSRSASLSFWRRPQVIPPAKRKSRSKPVVPPFQSSGIGKEPP